MLSPEEEEQVVAEVFKVLLETECLVILRYDDSGEPVYRVTEKCKDLFPEFYAMHQAEINQTANELWQKGVISINFTDDSESIMVTPANYAELKRVYRDLTDEQIDFMNALRSNKDD